MRIRSGRALLVFALAIFAIPLKANELWVAPAKNTADRLIADFAVADKKAHFGFGVPDNFNGFTKATVLLIGSKDQEIRYDLTLSISQNLGQRHGFRHGDQGYSSDRVQGPVAGARRLGDLQRRARSPAGDELRQPLHRDRYRARDTPR